MNDLPTPETGDAREADDDGHAPVEHGGERPGNQVRSLGKGLVRLVVLLVVIALAGALLLWSDASVVAVLGAVLLGLVILRIGWFFLQQFATPPPPPPDPGTLRRVRLTYRCETCGTEVRMTSAATDDPEPPRHCMEDMELIDSEE